MKHSSICSLAVTALITLGAASAFSNTMSVPNDEHASFTVDVPANWTPKVDKNDESLDATAPDNHVYLSSWLVTDADISDLGKDLAATLKDSMKSIDEGAKEETVENNGIHFMVYRGSGVDKREGGKVNFMFAVFQASEGKAGLVYADYDADAPADATKTLNAILNSIKLAKK
jgi:hypothetical protein